MQSSVAGFATQLFLSRGYFVSISGFFGSRRRGGDLRNALRHIGAASLEQIVLGSSSPFMWPDMDINHCILPLSGGKWKHGPLGMEPSALPAVCRTLGGTDAQVPDAELRSLMIMIAILAYAPQRQEPVTLVTPRFTQQSCARVSFRTTLGKAFLVAGQSQT